MITDEPVLVEGEVRESAWLQNDGEGGINLKGETDQSIMRGVWRAWMRTGLIIHLGGWAGLSVNPLTKAALVFGIDSLTGGQESVN